MNEIKNVVIVGIGAIGMIFASRIQHCENVNLYALVDDERKDRYIKNGIIFNGIPYYFNYVLPNNDSNIKSDLIIIATKSQGLKKAIKMIEKYVDDNTIIMSQLNGITSEKIIGKVYGIKKVLYSMMLGHTSARIDNSIIHDGNATVFFGEESNNSNSEKILRVKLLFEKARIAYKIPENIMYTMWQKLMANVGINQTTALIRADYSILKKGGKTTDLAIKLMNEVACVAKAVGIQNTEEMLPASLAIIEQMPSEVKSSMLQDLEANRQLEVDIFAGTISKIGKDHGVATPYNDMIFEILTAINEKNNS